MVTQIYEKESAFTNTYLITQAFYPPLLYPPKHYFVHFITFLRHYIAQIGNQ